MTREYEGQGIIMYSVVIPPPGILDADGWVGQRIHAPSFLSCLRSHGISDRGWHETHMPSPSTSFTPLHWGDSFFFSFCLSAVPPPPVLEEFIPSFYPIYPSHLGGNIVPAVSGSVNPKRPLFYCYPPLWGGKVFNLKNVFNKLKIN